jgi:hypothetical protein
MRVKATCNAVHPNLSEELISGLDDNQIWKSSSSFKETATCPIRVLTKFREEGTLGRRRGKEEGGRRKEEGGRRKEENDTCAYPRGH